MANIKFKTRDSRICQGDIYKNISFIESVDIDAEEKCRISIIEYPLVIVLTQDCDLESDHQLRLRLNELNVQERKQKVKDQLLMSILVSPLYNAEHVYMGEHLSEIDDLKMAEVPRPKPGKAANSSGNVILNNNNPRYHYVEFESQIVPSIIDFKHYFTVATSELLRLKATNFMFSLEDLYRERISQRFTNFLSRIGLPGNRE